MSKSAVSISRSIRERWGGGFFCFEESSDLFLFITSCMARFCVFCVKGREEERGRGREGERERGKERKREREHVRERERASKRASKRERKRGRARARVPEREKRQEKQHKRDNEIETRPSAKRGNHKWGSVGLYVRIFDIQIHTHKHM